MRWVERIDLDGHGCSFAPPSVRLPSSSPVSGLKTLPVMSKTTLSAASRDKPGCLKLSWRSVAEPVSLLFFRVEAKGKGGQNCLVAGIENKVAGVKHSQLHLITTFISGIIVLCPESTIPARLILAVRSPAKKNTAQELIDRPNFR